MNINSIVFALSVALSAILISVSAKIIVKRESGGQLDNQNGYLPSVEKRPFCNAFTGCGKKRSPSYDTLEIRALTDPMMRLNSKLVKEAKLWELMQNRINSNEMNPLSLSGVDYITARKRRSINSDQTMKK